MKRGIELMAKGSKTGSDLQGRIETERDRLKAILDSMDDGIYIVGRDFRIQLMNRALQSAVGNGEGRLCHEFFGHSREDCEHCQHGISSFGPELRREIHLSSTRRDYEMAVSPIHDPEGDIARLHILRDITDRKRLEAQLQEYSRKLEAKVADQAEKLARQERLALLGEIAAGLAHEIRTPLGALITGIKLLEKGGQKPGDQEMIFGLLTRETARLNRKVSEFLSYASPRLPQRVEASIPSLLEEICTVLSTDRQLAGQVAIRAVVQPDLPKWPMDPDQIKEALLNIATNALQALQGAGHLALEARSFYEGVLEIFVKDDGPGIPPDALPHIFKPFYSRRPDGTGLGLAISKDIIESHGGHITVTSLPGRSTSFRITLPRGPAKG